MSKIKLPQTIQVGNLTVTQTENCYVWIQKEKHTVFYSQSDHPMELAELMGVVKFFREISCMTDC